jgi:chromosome segregation ATPase
MANDEIDQIPSIVPSRDTIVPSVHKSARGRKGRNRTNSGGTGIWTGLFLVIALVVAAVACAWAWQLQEQLHQANFVISRYGDRIGDLEDRLSDTDQGMNQNASVQAAKIRELDGEVRKLWDNVWKKSRERLAALEAASASQKKKIDATEKSLSSTRSKANSVSGDVQRLKSVTSDLEKRVANTRTSQAEVERVADSLNAIKLDLNKMNRRVRSNEEAAQSVDTFRRQIMSRLADVEASIRILQTTP